MKKNKMMRIASVLLVAVLLSTCAISGTYAKYTSQITGTDSARVAKWAFQVEEKTASVDANFTFDLFKTVNDTDGNTETDITSSNGDRIIAPGTQGEFTIDLKNASEVTAEYVVDFTVTNTANIPVEFSVNGGAWGDLADVTTPVNMPVNGTSQVVVSWRWAFNGGNDTHDTELGLNGTAILTVEATVTATQVN